MSGRRRECNKCKGQFSKVKICSGCRSVYYCSLDCQKADWRLHKPECQLSIESQHPMTPRTPSNKNLPRQIPPTVPKKPVLERGHTTGSIVQPPPCPPKPRRSGHTFVKEPLRREDVPREFSRFQYIPSGEDQNRIDTNLLIIFPGVGPDFEQYVKLSKSLHIPQCCYLVLQPPYELPFNSGWSWFSIFDREANLILPTKFEKRRVKELSASRTHLAALVGTLIEAYGWAPGNIFFLGFSQGAIMGVDFLLHCRPVSHSGFGGCVAISDSLLDEALFPDFVVNYPDPILLPDKLTPLFISHGKNDQRIPVHIALQKHQKLSQIYTTVNQAEDLFLELFSKGHQMISSSTEAHATLKFLSDRMILHHRELDEASPDIVRIDPNDKIEIEPL